MRKQTRVLGLVSAAAVLFAACSGSTATQAPASQAASQAASQPAASASAAASEAPSVAASPAAEAAKVRLQLQWAPQAQFAGYFAADQQGYYKDENLDGRVRRRRADRRPAAGRLGPRRPRVHDLVGPEGPRGAGVGLRPRRHRPGLPALRHPVGLLEGQRASTTPARLAGKKVGVWDFGNEFEVTAGLSKNCGLTPGPREQGRSEDAVPEGHPGLRHGRVPQQGDRRSPRR